MQIASQGICIFNNATYAGMHTSHVSNVYVAFEKIFRRHRRKHRRVRIQYPAEKKK